MTNLPAAGAAVEVLAIPLMRPLDPLELALLKIVWSPISEPDLHTTSPQWPTWDYVVRTMRASIPDCPDLRELVDGLPTVRRRLSNGNPYGLVWEFDDSNASNNRRIGLSIAGLFQLKLAGLMELDYPDALAELVGALAVLESKVQPLPNAVVSTQIELFTLTAWLTSVDRHKRYALPVTAISELLQREYARVNVFESAGKFIVELTGLWLVKYESVKSASAYLDQIALDLIEERAAPFRVSPLTLVQTLDYLGYVLADHPAWESGLRFINAPDLQSATALVLGVGSREEFETRLNGTWNVINQLGAPEIPQDVLASRFQGKHQGSLSRIDYWVESNLGDESQSRAMEALASIRAIRKIRVGEVHGSTSTRSEAILAKRRLGLPEVIVDWGSAWDVITRRLASAFDVLRQEVQSSKTLE